MVNVDKHSIHGAYGNGNPHVCFSIVFHQTFESVNLGEDHFANIHLDGGFIDFLRDFLAPKQSTKQ